MPILNYPICDLIHFDPQRRHLATVAHQSNLTQPLEYIAYLHNCAFQSSNSTENQLSLQLLSQMVATSPLRTEQISSLFLNTATIFVGNEMSSQMRKMTRHLILCLFEMISSSKSPLQGSERASQIDDSLLKVSQILTVKTAPQEQATVLSLLCDLLQERAETKLGTAPAFCQFISTNLQRIVLDPQKANPFLSKLLILVASARNTLDFPTLALHFQHNQGFFFAYYLNKFQRQRSEQGERFLVIQFISKEILVPLRTNFEESELTTLIKLLESVFDNFANIIYYEDTLDAEESPKSKELSQIKTIFSEAYLAVLLEWMTQLMVKHVGVQSDCNMICAIPRWFISLGMSKSISSFLEREILKKPKSMRTYVSYFVFSFHLGEFEQEAPKIVRQALKDIEEGFFRQLSFMNIFDLLGRYVKKSLGCDCKNTKLSIELRQSIVKLLYQHFRYFSAEALKEAVELCLMEYMLSYALKAEVETEENDTDEPQEVDSKLEDFSMNLWGSLCALESSVRVNIMSHISTILNRYHCYKMNPSFLEDLLLNIDQSQDIFVYEYAQQGLAVRAAYLNLVADALYVCEIPQFYLQEIYQFLRKVQLSKPTELIEVEGILSIYHMLLYVLNTRENIQQKYLHYMLERLLLVTDFSLNTLLLYEIVSIDVKEHSSSLSAILTLKTRVIQFILSHLSDDGYDVLELCCILYPNSMKPYQARILGTAQSLSQYHRFCFLLKPSPYPEIQTNICYQHLKEAKWHLLALMGPFIHQKRCLKLSQWSREDDETQQLDLIENEFTRLTLEDEFEKVKSGVYSLMRYFDETEEDILSHFGQIEKTSVSGIIREYYNQFYRKSKLHKMVDKEKFYF